MDFNIRKLEMDFHTEFGKPSVGNEAAFIQYIQAMALVDISKQIQELKVIVQSLPKEFAKLRPVK
jgi:hypothetical protein